MPIRAEFRGLYPADWREISQAIRFGRAGGHCQRCCRPHGATLRVLPDGRWFDPVQRTWRDGRGKPARWPDIEDAIRFRETRVVLADRASRPQSAQQPPAQSPRALPALPSDPRPAAPSAPALAHLPAPLRARRSVPRRLRRTQPRPCRPGPPTA